MPETGLTLQGERPLVVPSDVVAQAITQANALMDIVMKRELFTQIGSKKFLQAEAWQIISSFNETAWVTDWVRPIEVKGEILAYEAKVNLVKRGEVVGAAIMSCGLDDDVCKSRIGWDKNKTAISAAETWAGAKASRMKFAWVAVLAGFAPTPAEEMIDQKEGERAEKRRAAKEEAPIGLCPIHTVGLVHRVGVSKAGKPYDGHFCPTSNCKHVVWADSLKVFVGEAEAIPEDRPASPPAEPPAMPEIRTWGALFDWAIKLKDQGGLGYTNQDAVAKALGFKTIDDFRKSQKPLPDCVAELLKLAKGE